MKKANGISKRQVEKDIKNDNKYHNYAYFIV